MLSKALPFFLKWWPPSQYKGFFHLMYIPYSNHWTHSTGIHRNCIIPVHVWYAMHFAQVFIAHLYNQCSIPFHHIWLAHTSTIKHSSDLNPSSPSNLHLPGSLPHDVPHDVPHLDRATGPSLSKNSSLWTFLFTSPLEKSMVNQALLVIVAGKNINLKKKKHKPSWTLVIGGVREWNLHPPAAAGRNWDTTAPTGRGVLSLCRCTARLSPDLRWFRIFRGTSAGSPGIFHGIFKNQRKIMASTGNGGGCLHFPFHQI